MKRLTLGLFLTLSMVGLAVLELPGQPVRAVPTPPDRLRPGQERPSSLACSYYEPDFARQYCQGTADVDVTVEDGRIVRSYVFTYPSGLRVGDALAAWGRPVGADYSGYGAVELYWLDRWLYALDEANGLTRGGAFTPFSRVGFVAYGTPQGSAGPWQGFRNGP